MVHLLTKTFALTMVLLVVTPVWAQQAQGSAADEKAVREVREAFEKALNDRDAEAAIATFAEDANMVEVDGKYYGGKDAIGKMIEDWLDANKGVTVKFTRSWVRFIRPDIALNDAIWEITGRAEGKGPARGRETAVLEKRDGKWLFIAVRVMVPIAPGE